MTLQLPDAIALYFTVSNGADAADLAQCFADDAVVLDEGQTHQGHEAIVTWMRRTRSKFHYTVEPQKVSQEGGRVRVAATVAGDFPGSPVQLEHVFGLQGSRIQSLEIH